MSLSPEDENGGKDGRLIVGIIVFAVVILGLAGVALFFWQTSSPVAPFIYTK